MLVIALGLIIGVSCISLYRKTCLYEDIRQLIEEEEKNK